MGSDYASCKRANGSTSAEGGKNLSFNIVPVPKETSFQQDEVLKKIKKGMVNRFLFNCSPINF